MKHAFLVEDDDAARGTLSEALAALADARVAGWAASEDAAVAWLSRNPREADFVVLDLFLDAGSGLGALARIRQLPDAPPVLVLSGGATSLLARSCMLLGAQGVYDKAANLDSFFRACAGMPALHRPARAAGGERR